MSNVMTVVVVATCLSAVVAMGWFVAVTVRSVRASRNTLGEITKARAILRAGSKK